jgi:CRP-like cAMP-binding protein
MQSIRALFDRSFVQSDADWKAFSALLEQVAIPKKTLLLKPGQTEGYLSFIEFGIIRYFVPHDTREITFAFSFDGEMASAYDSFLTGSPCTYAMETLTDTSLWRIRKAELEAIYSETAAGNIIGRKAAEALFIRKSRRELSLLTDSAEERYLRLFEEKPHLLQHIPLKYLASYIGITPQALSRIRRRIS